MCRQLGTFEGLLDDFHLFTLREQKFEHFGRIGKTWKCALKKPPKNPEDIKTQSWNRSTFSPGHCFCQIQAVLIHHQLWQITDTAGYSCQRSFLQLKNQGLIFFSFPHGSKPAIQVDCSRFKKKKKNYIIIFVWLNFTISTDKDGRHKWKHSCLANTLNKGHYQSGLPDADSMLTHTVMEKENQGR